MPFKLLNRKSLAFQKYNVQTYGYSHDRLLSNRDYGHFQLDETPKTLS